MDEADLNGDQEQNADSYEMSQSIEYTDTLYHDESSQLAEPDNAVLKSNVGTNRLQTSRLTCDSLARLTRPLGPSLVADSLARLTRPLGPSLVADSLARLTRPLGPNLVADSLARLTRPLGPSLVADSLARLTRPLASSLVADSLVSLTRPLASSLVADSLVSLTRPLASSLVADSLVSLIPNVFAYPRRGVFAPSRPSNISVLIPTHETDSSTETTRELQNSDFSDPRDPVSALEREYWLAQFDSRVRNEGLRRVCRRLLSDGYYALAVQQAYIYIDNMVGEKSGCDDKYGADLMRKVFSPTNPILKLNELETRSDKSEQQGYMEVFAGAMTGIRNPRAHEYDIEDSPEEALERIDLADHLMRMLNRSTLR